MSHTPSDDEGLREEITRLRRERDAHQMDEPDYVDSVMALISQKIIEAFRQGQRVGQYQAADKLYGHTTTLWLFKDEPTHPKAEWAERISDLVKDCERYMNHNRKAYAKYVAALTTKQDTKEVA
jgi:hypothetical protein